MTKNEIWYQVNLNLIAKAIGELTYEQILKPEEHNSLYTLKLKSGVSYQFNAWKSVWEHLKVDSESLCRKEGVCDQKNLSAGQFFIDAQSELEMSDITLGHFLEEMHSTLYADMNLFEKNKDVTAEQMSSWDGNKVQKFLNGHPKLLLNKGRLGWAPKDFHDYSPESEKAFQLFWVAVQRNQTTFGKSDSISEEEILLQSLSFDTLQKFKKEVASKNRKFEDFVVLPVHPWQWQKIISLQWAGEIACDEIIPFGFAGDLYHPQISLRTLSHSSNSQALDIKLPLSVLNTSAVRGILERYMAKAAEVSSAMALICETDPLLKAAGTMVLEEKAGVSFKNRLYDQVKGAPYRYKETLGAIWRQSAESKLKPNEIAVMAGSLFHQDPNKHSLLGAYVRRSGLSMKDWLRAYFKTVVIPLYHLQLKYGLGLVAHGQNIVVRLTNFVPSGLFLKDFQGDLRISQARPSSSPLLKTLQSHLDSLPPHYLIHDLITGHFVTVLRFISEVAFLSDGFSEIHFYQILAEELKKYLQEHASLEFDQDLGIFEKKYQRVLLNKVRFKIGYADSAERPLPMLGSQLSNPMHSSSTNFGEIYE